MELTIKKEVTETVNIDASKPICLSLHNTIFIMFKENPAGHLDAVRYSLAPIEVTYRRAYDHEIAYLNDVNWKRIEWHEFHLPLLEALKTISDQLNP